MSRSAICLRSSVTSHINNKNDKRQHVMTSKDYMLLGANIRKRHEHADDSSADGDDGSSNKHHIFISLLTSPITSNCNRQLAAS